MTRLWTRTGPYRALAPAWMATIFWSSHRSWRGPSDGPSWFGDLLHAPIYGLLAVLIALGFGFGLAPAARRAGAIGLFGAVAWGALDEFHQSFVPGRCCDPRDVVTDAAGAVLALVGLSYIVHRRTPGILPVFAAAGAAVAAWWSIFLHP